MITVKVGKVPGAVREVFLNNCSTVRDALSAATLSADGHTITVDGEAASQTTTLSEGSKVLLTKNIKGNV